MYPRIVGLIIFLSVICYAEPIADFSNDLKNMELKFIDRLKTKPLAKAQQTQANSDVYVDIYSIKYNFYWALPQDWLYNKGALGPYDLAQVQIEHDVFSQYGAFITIFVHLKSQLSKEDLHNATKTLINSYPNPTISVEVPSNVGGTTPSLFLQGSYDGTYDRRVIGQEAFEHGIYSFHVWVFTDPADWNLNRTLYMIIARDIYLPSTSVAKVLADPSKPKIRVYPNPFNNQINFDFSEKYDKIFIYNVAGKLIRQLPAQSIVWDGKDNQGRIVSKGVYVTNFQGNFQTKTEKLIIKK